MGGEQSWLANCQPSFAEPRKPRPYLRDINLITRSTVSKSKEGLGVVANASSGSGLEHTSILYEFEE
jgi:hypothetical protein